MMLDEQALGDEEAEDGISQELEAFIGARVLASLVGIRPMDEGGVKQRPIRERVPQSELELTQWIRY